MTKTEVAELLRYINGAYPRFTINDNTPAVWYEMLQEKDFKKTLEFLKKHISDSRYEPSISDLLKEKEMTLEEKDAEFRKKWGIEE